MGILERAKEIIKKTKKGKSSTYKMKPERLPRRCLSCKAPIQWTKSSGKPNYEVRLKLQPPPIPPEVWHIHTCRHCKGKTPMIVKQKW